MILKVNILKSQQKHENYMSELETEKTGDVPKKLAEWAKEYYGKNKEVMQLLGIYCPDEISRRILEAGKQHI